MNPDPTTPAILEYLPSNLESSPRCRICWRDSSAEFLIKPCKCKGSLQYVHRICLERLLEAQNTESCERCKYHFKVIRTRSSFREWWNSADGRRQRLKIYEELKICGFLFLIVTAVVFLFVSSLVCKMHKKDMRHTDIGIATLLLSVLFLFMLLTCIPIKLMMEHWKICTQWRDNVWHVHLVEGEGPSNPEPTFAAVATESPLSVNYKALANVV